MLNRVKSGQIIVDKIGGPIREDTKVRTKSWLLIMEDLIGIGFKL